MSGGAVFDAYLNGNVKAIRDYCETDVMNTYLVYLRWELVRGNLDPTRYQQECTLLREWLMNAGGAHFQQFLEAWEDGEA